MRISVEWLSRYVDIDIPVEELAERLTMAGLSVEGIEHLGEDISLVVVGQIVSLADHPGAPKLRIAQVDAGHGRRLTLVSGAPNLNVGDKVPVALPGARLPGDVTIDEAEFRGVISQGMLISEAELGLAAHSDGIMILDQDAPMGESLVDYLRLKDVVLEIELTANRPDCHSLVGVAREVAAILGKEVRYPVITFPEDSRKTADLLQVEVVDQDLCPRYMAKVFTDVKVGPSPLWLKRCLISAGMRPINNVVDITNFVLLEQNQPLHAFDYDKLTEGRLVIRRAKAGEHLISLDENDRTLTESMLVIADQEHPVCIAGVMGGLNSEIDETTTTIALESAWFEQVSIRRTSRNLGLRSEASARFERGLNPENVSVALKRAAQLFVELCGATALTGEIDVYPCPQAPVVIDLVLGQVNGLLGTDLAAEEVANLLDRLPGFTLKPLGTGQWRVTVPAYRRDVSVAADLVEEVARLRGYDTIPSTLPAAPEVVGLLSPVQAKLQKVKTAMVGSGFSEVITYSLANEAAYRQMGLEAALARKVDLVVPLSEELRFMRTSMLPSIVGTLSFNFNRGHKDLALFEVGRIYLVNPKTLPTEDQVLALGLMGNASSQDWFAKPRSYDFYDIKGAVEAVLAELRCDDVAYVPGGDKPPYHPWRNAEVVYNGRVIGSFGELHPKYGKQFGFTVPVYIGELTLDSLVRADTPQVSFRKLPKFPASRKDIAVVLPHAVASAEVLAAIRDLAGNYLEEVRVFDQYVGAQVGKGKKSLAFSMLLRHPERTLTDPEIASIVQAVSSGLRTRFEAELRG